MYALVSPKKIELSAGAVVKLPATWPEYIALREQRGDGSVPRIKYRDGEVFLVSPLPVHGRDVSLVADIVKALLDHREKDYDSFTPMTMELPEQSGIEPDYCFYIDNWQAVSGKKRIDWRVDPPPDLVVEIDVTSYSDVVDYLPFWVPEIWLVRKQQLSLYRFENGDYKESKQSLYFPDTEVCYVVDRCFEIAYERNTSAAIRDLRKRLKGN